MIPDNQSGIIGAIATIVAIALVLFMIIRRRERRIAKLGYFPSDDPPVRLTGLVHIFTGYEPVEFQARDRSQVPMYMMELQVAGDEGPISCVAAETGVSVGGRILFLKAYGNMTILKIADKIGGRLLDEEYARQGLKPLVGFNDVHVKEHGIKAYADFEPDTGSPRFKNLLLPVMEFEKDAAGAGYADGYVLAWCSSPKRANDLCERMAGAVQSG